MPFDPSATRSGSVFSDNPNYAGAWLVYVNGVETPTIGFEVDYGVWQIPSFRIHLIPDILIQRIGQEDRVPVQIFYLDPWATDEPTFRLLVDGEIVGWSYSSATGQRSIAFSCLAHIHLFQQLYFFYMTTVDDIVGSHDPSVLASAVAVPGLLYPYSLFHQGLLSTKSQVLEVDTTTPDTRDVPEDAQPIKAPYELVTNVIKGIISENVPANRRAVPMVNFFARHTRKVRFHNRWVRLPMLEDPEALEDRKGVFPIFAAARNDQAMLAMQRQVASQMGSSGPVWNLFEQILKMVHMEIAMIPNPACVQVALADLAPGQPQEGKIIKLLPDKANEVTTRRGVDPAAIRQRAVRLTTEVANMIAGRQPIKIETLREAGFTQVPSISEVSISVIYNKLFQTANNAATVAGVEEESTVDPMKPIRLAQHFVKPPFTFGEVPVCNVLLPSQVDSWTYDESYITQPTRIYVNDAVMTRLLRAQGANRELMLHALTVGFPEEADALMHHKVASSAANPAGDVATGGAESGRNLLLWPEEFYKGPVTARAELPSWFQFMRQFANANPPEPQTPEQIEAAALAAMARTAGQLRTAANLAAAATDAADAAAVAASARATAANPPDPALTAAATAAAAAAVTAHTNATNAEEAARTAEAALATRRSRATPTQPAAPQPPSVTGMATPTRIPGSPLASAPLNIVQPPPTVFDVAAAAAAARRNSIQGRPQSRADWPFRWIPDAETERRALAQNVRAQQNFARWEGPPEPRNLRPSPGIERLASHIASRFPAARFELLRTGLTREQVKRVIAYGRGSSVARVGTSRGRDAHEAGVAADFMIPTVNHRPDLVIGNPVANYLIANAEIFGVQRVVWARTVWEAAGLGPRGRVTLAWDNRDLTGPEAERRDHANHIHVELNQEGANLLAPFFRNGAPLSPNVQSRLTTVRYALGRVASGSGPVALPGIVTPNPPNTPAGPAPTTGHTATTSQAGTAAQGDAFSDLFRLYAQQEYLKQRYDKRNGAANLRFNPYLLPGFPVMIFDKMTSRMHCVGSLQTIHHSGFASSGGSSMSTQIQVSYCRTIHEFINDVRNDANRFSGRVTSAPAEIIREIRVVIQDQDNADKFFSRLLYGATPERPRRSGGLPAVFKWDAVLGYARGAQIDPIRINGASVSEVEAAQQAIEDAARLSRTEGEEEPANPAEPPNRRVEHNLNPNEELSPNPGLIYSDAFDNRHLAMQLAARPVCTLEQYIRFWHGGKTLTALINSGDVEEPRLDFAYQKVDTLDIVGRSTNGQNISGTVTRATAIYFGRIFKLRPGPGREPGEAERGYTDPPAIAPAAQPSGVPADYPQTRADWDTVLVAYRNKIRNRVGPST